MPAAHGHGAAFLRGPAPEDKIKDMIKQQVQNDPALKRKTGILADVMA